MFLFFSRKMICEIIYLFCLCAGLKGDQGDDGLPGIAGPKGHPGKPKIFTFIA